MGIGISAEQLRALAEQLLRDIDKDAAGTKNGVALLYNRITEVTSGTSSESSGAATPEASESSTDK
jgi:hypothetical protein